VLNRTDDLSASNDLLLWLIHYTTTVNNFVDCGFYHTKLKDTHIHFHPQNNHRWPLCKSANIGIAAGNTAERYLQEGLIRLSLWQQRSLRPTEIVAHVAFLSSGEKKRNRMVQDQVSMDGVAKR
jgi:hypothetical protein